MVLNQNTCIHRKLLEDFPKNNLAFDHMICIIFGYNSIIDSDHSKISSFLNKGKRLIIFPSFLDNESNNDNIGLIDFFQFNVSDIPNNIDTKDSGKMINNQDSYKFSFGDLENLTYLNFGFNSFSGEIPESIGNLVQLEEFYLTENFFSGRIPESIGNLTDLTMLSIYNNQFSGDIPESIGNLTNIVSINAGINQLSGQLPSNIGNLTNLERLWLNSER